MDLFWGPDDETVYESPSRSQRDFERKCVGRVLRAFGLAKHEQGLIEDYQAAKSPPGLSFRAFFAGFPTFPVMLSAQSFFNATARKPWMRLPSFMKGFGDTFIWQRYCALHFRYQHACRVDWGLWPDEALPPSLHGLPLGMIFPYDGMRSGLILHNGEPLTRGFVPRFEARMEGTGQGRPIRCWVEPFGDWLSALAERGWSPGVRNPVPLESTPDIPEPTREGVIAVRPWAVRALGCGPAAYLLSWLLHVIRADPETHPVAASFRVRDDGAIHVAATQAELGCVLRLTDKQVRSAVTRLRAEGFIETRRCRPESGPKTMFVVDEDRCFDARQADWDTAQSEDWPSKLEQLRAP